MVTASRLRAVTADQYIVTGTQLIQKLTWNLIQCDKIWILLLYFWPVSGYQENSQKRQQTAAKEFNGATVNASLMSCRYWFAFGILTQKET